MVGFKIKNKDLMLFLSVMVCSLVFFVFADKVRLTKYDIAIIKEQGITNIVPIAIVGSGPAGYSAGLYSARSSFKTVDWEGDNPGGLLMNTSEVENWPGILRKMGPAIMEDLREQAASFGMIPIRQTIEKVDFNQWPFLLTTEDGEKIHALTVIVATGASPRMLGIPGEQEYSGGKGVATCARCDALFFKDKEVIVVGGGDSAAEDAMQLAPHAKKVTIFVRKPAMAASAIMQKHLTGYANIQVRYGIEVHEVLGDGKKVTGVRLFNTKEQAYSDFPIDGVFVAVGHIPTTWIFKDSLPLDKHGYIEVLGKSQKTVIEGVYAAGDVEDVTYRQAGVAAGSGIKAAIDAITFLTSIGYTTEFQKEIEPLLYKEQKTNNAAHASAQAIAAQNVDQITKLVHDSSELVVIDVHAEYCPPCQIMLPVVDRLAVEYSNRVKFVTVDFDGELVQPFLKEYNIKKAPHLLFFKNGVLVDRLAKTLTHKEFTALLDELM